MVRTRYWLAPHDSQSFVPVNGTLHCRKRTVASVHRSLGGATFRRSTLEFGKGAETLRHHPRCRRRGGHHSRPRTTARARTLNGSDVCARAPAVGPSSALPLSTVPLLRYRVHGLHDRHN